MTLQEILLESYYSGNVYQGWITAAIGAAGSIIGGLFGSKKKKEETITDQTTTSESSVDYQAMADKAAAAGYNPLTAIRNGGTGGFVTTQTRTQGKNVTTTSGGGASIGAGIADAAAQIAPLFGSMSAARADPIKVKNKTTGAISPLVSQQLRGSTLRAGSVVVAPRQTTRSSPVTSTAMSAIEGLNSKRMHYGSFIGPRYPTGTGPNGEIEDAMVAYRRSDGSLMHTYNPKHIDGDAAVAAAATDAVNRVVHDGIVTPFRFPSRGLPQSMLPSIPAQSGKVGRYRR